LNAGVILSRGIKCVPLSTFERLVGKCCYYWYFFVGKQVMTEPVKFIYNPVK